MPEACLVLRFLVTDPINPLYYLKHSEMDFLPSASEVIPTYQVIQSEIFLNLAYLEFGRQTVDIQ
jgi:hypothetical protein